MEPIPSLETRPGRPLRGRIRVPGDKSISHRALIFNAVARGRARVSGLLDAGDVRSTAACLRALGVEIQGGEVLGTAGALREPASVLDCGNSGTTLRLLCGLLAPMPLFAVLTGDASLRQRPMGRVTSPLIKMGARFDGRSGGERAPLALRGGPLSAISCESPVASAQIKTALLLATLGASGELRFREPHLSRDHSERMLAHMGIALCREGEVLVMPGGQVPEARDFTVPGDLSSAAFFLVAASLVPGSNLVIEGVGVNPTRDGALEVLRRMGARITELDRREEGGEPVADLRVEAAPLAGVRFGGALIPRLIDEIPALAVAAAFAEGETVITGAAELRVKESDRAAAVVAGLRAIGAEAEELPDGMVIRGGRPSGGEVDARGDHRIAMAFAVAGLAAPEGCRIGDASAISTSFPRFVPLLEQTRA